MNKVTRNVLVIVGVVLVTAVSTFFVSKYFVFQEEDAPLKESVTSLAVSDDTEVLDAVVESVQEDTVLIKEIVVVESEKVDWDSLSFFNPGDGKEARYEYLGTTSFAEASGVVWSIAIPEKTLISKKVVNWITGAIDTLVLTAEDYGMVINPTYENYPQDRDLDLVMVAAAGSDGWRDTLYRAKGTSVKGVDSYAYYHKSASDEFCSGDNCISDAINPRGSLYSISVSCTGEVEMCDEVVLSIKEK